MWALSLLAGLPAARTRLGTTSALTSTAAPSRVNSFDRMGTSSCDDWCPRRESLHRNCWLVPYHRSLQEPGKPPVLQHTPTRLLVGAVGGDVLGKVHGRERRPASRARLALAPVDLERHRQLVGH